MNIYFEDNDEDEGVPAPWWVEGIILAAVFALIGALAAWYGRS